ncbi:non-ribosomal peptide synthetase [Longimicrobium terrae]|uniref:Amino acid adenylation domain-containing protein n=1 Tax=Longimicrobium terrae TaxID=1639882 RepID=A0A841H2H4_9BACT|nr:non-ribosomal peptide synthetase [Longimicrobium terrae]MBB4637946.1 amino acid adenylation domain-containing protein [Longimicrobium terrae]MBB6072193.1 amino acid adenylation domain-containing protein [Longimicrobium terrae]NNC28381.1 amino acid adenylation domain-containing protein [Longimicrobium terrae]
MIAISGFHPLGGPHEARPFPSPGTAGGWSGGVHRRIEAAAHAAPDATAAALADSVLSYARLNAGANRLARRLLRAGVKADARVGIVMERGPELAVALLAVLKAGAAYVPVDPDSPEDRTRFLLADSGAALVLTDAASAARVPEGSPPVIVVALEDGAGEDEGDLPADAEPDALAYVIYTSGTTGRPKGVGVTHRALDTHCDTVIGLYRLSPADRVAQVASLGFDISVEEIIPTWAAGAAVVFRPAHLSAYGAAFHRWLEGSGITLLNVPTAFWHSWTGDLSTGGGALPPALRLVIVGGERALPHVWDAWARIAGPAVTWINCYGPTETTVGVTAHVRGPGFAEPGRGDIPIGHPLPDAAVHVLDEAMRPVAPGDEGELVVGGPRVARGYLGRPGTTAESFVPDPFSAEPGARMYRTGDRARWPAGGEIEFLGRVDGQVKVGGFRVEPAEVEAVLSAHPGVVASVVVAREDAPGRRRLIGYWVTEPDAPPSDESLRAWLMSRLPAWMVPATLVRLDALPLTASGKVDRRALPAPVQELLAEERGTAPRTPTQQVLAEVWADVLGAARIGEYDDFFALGGHSLLGMQVMSRIRQLLGVEIPVRALFDAPTLATFAEVVDEWRGVDSGPGQPPLEPADRAGALPLSFAQQRLWFLHQLEPESPFYNIPAAIRLEGALDAEALRRALQEIVRRHEALRTVYPVSSGQPAQLVLPAERFDLPVHDLTALSANAHDAAVAEAARRESVRRYDLERDGMLRATLLRLGAESHVLLINLHHVAGDGWSLGVLFHELGALYGDLARGRAPSLPPLPVQYADYAVWQRRWLTEAVLETQLAYWRERLGDAPPQLELPTDRARPAVQSHRGDVVRFRIPAALTDRLHAFARAEGATLYMTLLAGLNVLLHRWSGQDDVVVGSPIAGRVRRELEGLIGFFVNTMALRTDLRGEPGFRELVGRVREATLDAYAHQDLPFERIVEELQPERSLSRSPVFQVSLVLQNAPTPPMEMAGLQLRLDNLSSATSKFDLALEFVEDADGLAGEAEFAADLWDRSTVERMAAQLAQVLDAAIADPTLPIHRIPILPAAEKAKVTAAWTRGGAAVSSLPVHRAFEAAAARTPDAIALEQGGRRVTFGELDARANRIARALMARGIGTESRVGVFAERAPETVAALLGILKAGGAYVPLDPRYPAARLRYMARQADVSLILAQDHIAERLPDTGAAQASIGALWRAEGDPSPVTVETDEAALAYVIYTSGSTGEPKGVAVPHGSLSAYLGWATAWYDLGGRGAPVHSPLAFDLTVSSLWLPLLRGEPVILVADSEGPDGLAAALRAHSGLGLVKLTPTHLSLLRNQLGAEAGAAAPRAFVIGGESLEGEVAAFWGAYAPDAVLFNEYGPTEATVGCCVQRVPAGVEYAGAVPIGRPVPGTRLYVLDAHGEPSPIGVPGELWIGGAQLARGYLGRPGATAERFVPDPFSDIAGARAYRTGDRVRWLADGTLDFLGRLDDMVKIRGFRIEPAEVEAVLAQHPEVSDAAVDVRADAGGEPRLVGYVVPAPEPEDAAVAGSVDADDPADAQVSQWESVFEGMYGGSAADDVTFNIVGWNSSYTGAPIPAAQMREWVDRTADRILALKPRRVLELGVGSGLFLFRVAPHAQSYTGCDLSPTAIRNLHDALPRSGLRLPPVRLMARPADDLHGFGPGEFDTVILNSVIQYFPSAAYLARVLEGAVDRVADGGAVFVGDVRSLATLSAFHAGTEAAHLPGDAPAAELRARLIRRAEEEEELVLDPRFFAALRARVPRIRRVEVKVKRGEHRNELSAHRYDVILHVGGKDRAPVPARELAWGAEVDRVEHLRALLKAGAALRVSSIPDTRVIGEVRLADAAAHAGTGVSIDALLADEEMGGADPEALYRLGEERGMRTELRPSAEHPGCMDAAFIPRVAGEGAPAFAAPVADRPLAGWSNDPRRGARIRRLVPALRAFLRDHLPEYMVPAALVVVDEFPQTENGKTDRRALPDPPQTRAAGGRAYRAPVTETESLLCALWAELLRVDAVGADDDFFELGGHSLLATVLVSRVREMFGVEMPLHRVFQTPTVAGLAAAVDEENEQVTARLLAELDELSDDEARALLALEAEGVVDR